MYAALHTIFVTLFAVAPVITWVVAVRRSSRRRSYEPLATFVIVAFMAIILGTAVVVLFDMTQHGKVLFLQMLQSWYFFAGLLCLLLFLRWALREGSLRLLHVTQNVRGHPENPRSLRASLAFILQAVGWLAIGLPLIVGTLIVHRVKVHSDQTPLTLANCDYEVARFPAIDGVGIAGWWIPAEPATSARHQSGDRTVIMCLGIGDDLSRQAGLLRVLITGGYNVLAIDLRGNGESEGQWVGFGDTERRDVLGAVRWLMSVHPEEARTIYGLGGGFGGAAVISAAADPSPEGQAIRAVAVLDTYADFPGLARAVIADRIAKPFRSTVLHLITPIASAGAGVNLAQFAPAELASRLWPRPILVVHGRLDAAFPVSQGEALFDAATYPRQSLWLVSDHAGTYRSRRAAGTVLQFFDEARSIPAI